MTTSSPKPRRRHGKFLIALFATTAALAGGGQVAAPSPATAMTDDGGGTECAPWETEFFNECTEGSGGSDGGSTGDGGSGDGTSGDDGGVGGDGPIVGGEVIRVESTAPKDSKDNGHYCGSGQVLCIPPFVPYSGPRGSDLDRGLQKTLKREIEHLKEAEAKKKRKADEDKKYADCIKETKKYMLPGQRPICPEYCPVDEKYHTPLDKDNGCDPELIPNVKAKGALPWEVYLKGVKTCHRISARLKNLEDLAERLKAAGSYSDEAWHAHGFESHEKLLRIAWEMAVCSDYIAT